MNVQHLRNELISADKLSCIIYFEEIASTNKYAKELSDIDDALILADHQSAGTGRFGRIWESSQGKDLIFSLIKKFGITIDNIHLVNFYSSYIMFLTLKEILADTNIELILKWPNDILLNGKKVCGILLDVQELNEPEKKFIIGMGVNVNSKSFNEEINFKAISLNQNSESKISREEILIMFVNNFYKYISYVDDGEKLMSLWKKNTKIIGKKVNFKMLADGENILAEVIDIGSDGGLRVKIDETLEKTFYSGEITFVY